MALMSHVAFFLAFSAEASDTKDDLLAKYSNELATVESYLNNIKNLTADFRQITSQGAVNTGKFYLSRPGKMRVRYDTDPAIVIVVNGPVLSYYDVELEEISNLRTNTTPASFLTRKNISFSARDIDLLEVEKERNLIKVTLAKKNNRESGKFSIVFNLNPVSFLQMEVRNDLDDVVNVSLKNLDLVTDIDDDLFILKTK